MNIKNIMAFLLGLLLISCGNSENNNSATLDESTLSRQNAIQCLDAGDLSCAKNNFCGLQQQNPADTSFALRCCVSQFLHVAFSENTQHLGKMLGYEPIAFSSLKNNDLATLISRKKIIFGELIFLPEARAPKLRDLMIQWGQALISAQSDSHELNRKFIQLGSDLESVHQCLSNLPQKFSQDELEGNFFGSQEKTKISPRDLAFLQFASGTLAYLFQSIPHYEWGFDHFPAWPLNDSFYQDINGKLDSGDPQFGDIESSALQKVAAKAKLLKSGLRSFENFLHQNQTGLIDLWLRWRFSQSDLIEFTSVLRSAHASFEAKNWMGVSGESFILNTSSLEHTESLPDAQKLSPDLELLRPDESGNPEINSDYLKQLFTNLIYIPTH